jgi:hypothetical protein
MEEGRRITVKKEKEGVMSFEHAMREEKEDGADHFEDDEMDGEASEGLNKAKRGEDGGESASKVNTRRTS